MSQVDLHLHSSASDGCLSPAELVAEAARRGLEVIALTDHDTVDGIAPALAAAEDFPGLMVIPGVELSTEVDAGEVHVLGYFIDYDDVALNRRLIRMRNSRADRAQAMISRLEALGVDISWEHVQKIADGGSVGRPHLAQAMLEQGYVPSIREAFNGYLARGRPAYVGRQKLTPEAAVELIRQSDGLAVLAHPFTVADPEPLVIKLKAAGLAGLEAYYKDYDADTQRQLLEIADRHGLLVTGGSDYHGLEEDSDAELGGVEVPFSVVDRLLERKRDEDKRRKT
jgi:predicted metal-dependent phosphoesterase TrpH